MGPPPGGRDQICFPCKIILNLLYREEEREMLPFVMIKKIKLCDHHPTVPLAAVSFDSRDWDVTNETFFATDKTAQSKYDQN